MTSEQFVYWMQGFAELNAEPPTAEQWQSIREHLATVFVKVTPKVNLSSPLFPLGLRDPSINWPQPHEIKITCDASGKHLGEWPNRWADRLPVGGK